MSDLPKALVHKRGFAWIWLVPVVALGIVLWLGFQHFANQGPTIQIHFQKADGLEAGKTQIKHKNVVVGTVSKIELTKDMKGVVVAADMDHSIDDYLGPDTKFWVVRPRFTSGSISGLDTLVSGSYITMEPSKGEEAYEFTGLEEPPVTLNDVPGRHYTLHTDRLAALDEGSSLYYRGIEVGAVQGYKLNEKGDSLDIYIFVRDPFTKYVTEKTRFWNASGVDIQTGASGFQIKTEGLRALLSGGVTFETPTANPGPEAAQGTTFVLYESEHWADIDPRNLHFLYTVQVPGQLHGVGIPAPVELNGVRIGRIVDISQSIDGAKGVIHTPITIEIEANQMKIDGFDQNAPGINPSVIQAKMDSTFDQLIRKGLRAQLASASLLTGQRFIQLSIQPDQPEMKLVVGGAHPEIPAVESGTIEDMTRSANTLLKHADKVVGNLYTLTGGGQGQLQQTVKSLDGTIKDLDRVFNNVDADLKPLGQQLPQVLNELKDAERSVRSLVDYVDQHPEALLTGRASNEKSAGDTWQKK